MSDRCKNPRCKDQYPSPHDHHGGYCWACVCKGVPELIDLAKQRFFSIPLTCRFSTTMTDLVFASSLVALCKKSARWHPIR